MLEEDKHIFGISASRSIGISQKFSRNASLKGKQTSPYYGISSVGGRDGSAFRCTCTWLRGNTVARKSLFSLYSHISRNVLQYSDRSQCADSKYVFVVSQNYLISAQIDCDKLRHFLSQCVKIDGANAGDDKCARNTHGEFEDLYLRSLK